MRSTYRIAQRVRLAIVTVGVIFTALWIAMLVWLFQLEGESSRQALLHSAQTIMAAVDAQIERYAAVGRALVVTLSGTSGDIASLERQARLSTAGLTDAWLLLSDPDGQQAFNTLIADGRPLPVRNATALAAQRQACATGTEQVSDVGIGPATQKPVITVNFPLNIDARCYTLAVVFYADSFAPLMEGLPGGWLAGVLDRQGNYVARSLGGQAVVGQPGGPGWRAIMHQSGVFEFSSREGESLLNANQPSARTGWATAVALRRVAFYEPLWRSIALAGIAGAIAITVSLLVVAALGRRFNRALTVVKRAADSLRNQEVVDERTGEEDLDAILDSLSETARQLALHDRQMLLASSEVMHRSKNILMVVLSMARFIARGARSLDGFIDRFEQRLLALSRSQDLLIENQWHETSLRQIAQSQVGPFAESRLVLDGADIVVGATSVQPLSMIFHELATNAAKHGALSAPGGNVRLSWKVSAVTDDGPQIEFLWVESGGPVVGPGDHTGYGNIVITESVRSLRGLVKTDYSSGALVCSFGVQLEPRRFARVAGVA